ncbi:hypothetical protein [Herbidospora cretacea]|uniref:hypothetical protein n=1 Tax=Herbidospora cretacea TaxID=28444 RepID=UPI00077472E2|nr:hypothetical protein [Herbidospora cretacea]
MRPALAALAALLLLTACSKPAPKPLPGTEVPTGFHRIGGTANGVSIGVPTSWKSVDLAKDSFETELAATGLTGSALEQARQGLQALTSAKAVYALDPASQKESKQNFVTNLNGFCQPSVGGSNEALIEQAKQQLTNVGATITEAAPAKVGAGQGVRITYSLKMPAGTVQGTQYYAHSTHSTTCVITLTTDLPGKESLFEQIGSTIRTL